MPQIQNPWLPVTAPTAMPMILVLPSCCVGGEGSTARGQNGPPWACIFWKSQKTIGGQGPTVVASRQQSHLAMLFYPSKISKHDFRSSLRHNCGFQQSQIFCPICSYTSSDHQEQPLLRSPQPPAPPPTHPSQVFKGICCCVASCGNGNKHLEP